MIERAFAVLGANALAATLLFLAALVAQRFVTRPAIRHLLWLAVVVRLLLPPILGVPVQLPPAFSPTESRLEVDRLLPGNDRAGLATLSNGEPTAPFVTPPPSADPRPEAGATGEGSPSPVEETASALPMALILGSVQLAGALLVLVVAAWRWTRFRALLRAAEPPSAALAARVDHIAARLGVRRAPRVLVVDTAVPPLLFPSPGTTLVLSSVLLARLDDDEIDALLAHELTHVRRGDPWIRPLEVLATALYWWFPLLGPARERLRAAEESACDRAVVRELPRLRRSYANGLLKAVELVSTSKTTTALATGAADSRNLKERIVNIFQPAKDAPWSRRRRALALIPLLAAVSLTPAWTRPDVAPPAPAPPPDVPLQALAAIERLAPPAPPEHASLLAQLPLPLTFPMLAQLPDREAEMIRAELMHRKAEYELQRRLLRLRREQGQVEGSFDELARARHLAEMAAELRHLSEQGDDRAVAELQRAIEMTTRITETDASLRKQELLLQRQQEELQLKTLEAELRHSEALLAEDEEQLAAVRRQMEELQVLRRELDLESLKLEVERAKTDLEHHQKQYERMVEELEAAEAAEKAERKARGEKD